MTEKRRPPLMLDLGETPLPDAPSPADAPPPDDAPPVAAEQALRVARKRGGLSALGALFWSAAGVLLSLWIGMTAEAFISGLFERQPVLGWIGLVALVLVALALLTLALRELAALARLGRIEKLRAAAEAARDGGCAGADEVLNGLSALYARRPEAAEAIRKVTAARDDTPDAGALLDIAERTVAAPLDKRAERAVAQAAREVAAVTAVVPMPLIDVLAVLFSNLRMIRRVGEIYGGRSGWLGSWRLLRAVATHIVATGAVAATDDLLGPMVGGGVLGKLSRRFGEAAVNAALTARVGVAAMEVSRPLPFHARPAPRASSIVLGALRDWRGSGAE